MATFELGVRSMDAALWRQRVGPDTSMESLQQSLIERVQPDESKRAILQARLLLGHHELKAGTVGDAGLAPGSEVFMVVSHSPEKAFQVVEAATDGGRQPRPTSATLRGIMDYFDQLEDLEPPLCLRLFDLLGRAGPMGANTGDYSRLWQCAARAWGRCCQDPFLRWAEEDRHFDYCKLDLRLFALREAGARNEGALRGRESSLVDTCLVAIAYWQWERFYFDNHPQKDALLEAVCGLLGKFANAMAMPYLRQLASDMPPEGRGMPEAAMAEISARRALQAAG